MHASFGASRASGGWSSADADPRTLADINGEGSDDIVGFRAAGVDTALDNSDGTFAAETLAFVNFERRQPPEVGPPKTSTPEPSPI